MSSLWSKSQVSNFNECQRKYFLSRADKTADPEIGRLKSLKNRYLWAGSVVHETVGSLLKRIRQEEPLPSETELIETAQQRMRDEFRQSKDEATAANRLFEHEYSTPLGSGAWQENWKKVEKSLRWFLSSNWVKRLKTVGPECWKAVDEILSFDVDGVKSYVKIDCAVEIDNQFFLMDWKTSALKSQENPNPALWVPALYAHEVWMADPENISLMEISLLTGESKTQKVNEDHLMEAHLLIQEQSSHLQQAASNFESNPMDAPATVDKIKCTRCNFQRLCHPAGVEALYAPA